MAVSISMRTQVSQLYVSLFGRAPDSEGLGFWASSLDSSKSMAVVAQSMFDTEPARDYYPSYFSNREIIATFYLNVLGREADAEGLNFWTKEMDAAKTKGDVFAKLLDNVVNYTGSDPAGLKSQALFANKVAVAQYYGETKGEIEGSADVLNGITDKFATVIEAKAAIDASMAVLPPTYQVDVSASVFEGGSVTYTISTNNLEPGTTIAYTVTGTGNAATSAKDGVVTLDAEGKATVVINTTENAFLNDEGSLSFKLVSGNTVLKEAAPVVIKNNDVPATYSVAASANSIVEGGSVTYDITTTGVAPGTEIVYVVTGTGNGKASGETNTVTINSVGHASVTIDTLDNQTYGDAGLLDFKLMNVGTVAYLPVAGVSVTDNDSAPVGSTPITASISIVNTPVTEGDTVDFKVHTTGYDAGTELNYEITGTKNGSNVYKSGTLFVNALGNAYVTVGTFDNEDFADEGSLRFTVGTPGGTDSFETATFTLLNDDVPPVVDINTTWTLTTDDERLKDINGGNDTFVATVGSNHPTLNALDTLNGGVEGTDTLHIEVVSDTAQFPNWETVDFKNIENVVIDTTRNNLGGEDDAHGWEYFNYTDGTTDYLSVALDSTYFDRDGTLASLTFVNTNENETSWFDSVYIEKDDITVKYQGSGLSYPEGTSADLDQDILLGEEVTTVHIEIEGVGANTQVFTGSGGSAGPNDYSSAQLWFTQAVANSGDSTAVESLNVSGSLAAAESNYYDAYAPTILKDPTHNESSLTLGAAESYTSGYFEYPTPESITVSLEKTDDVDHVFVNIHSALLADVTDLSFADSEAGIETRLTAADFHPSEVDDVNGPEVNITLGKGDDTLLLNINADADADDTYSLEININAGVTTDDAQSDTIVLTNYSVFDYVVEPDCDPDYTHNGNISIGVDESSNDLLEDLIVINNFDVKNASEAKFDKLGLDLMIGYTDLESGDIAPSGGIVSGDINTNPYINFQSAKRLLDLTDVATEGKNSTPTDKFYAAVSAVAESLMESVDLTDSDLDGYFLDDVAWESYIGAYFVYGSDTYIYVDTNRDWSAVEEITDGVEYDYHALSNGDTLIKLTGIVVNGLDDHTWTEREPTVI